MPLIAYNINLDTSDLEIANKIARAIRAANGGRRGCPVPSRYAPPPGGSAPRIPLPSCPWWGRRGSRPWQIANKIARAIRAANGGFKYCKAIGVMLEERNIAQVSAPRIPLPSCPWWGRRGSRPWPPSGDAGPRSIPGLGGHRQQRPRLHGAGCPDRRRPQPLRVHHGGQPGGSRRSVLPGVKRYFRQPRLMTSCMFRQGQEPGLKSPGPYGDQKGCSLWEGVKKYVKIS